MANLSSFYPQPVVAGTTDGTFAEGDDTRIVGAVQKSIVDAKGDLIVGSADNTVARLPVGASNGHTLQIDSSTATGLKWAAAAEGGSTPSGPAGGGLAGTYPNPTLAPIKATGRVFDFAVRQGRPLFFPSNTPTERLSTINISERFGDVVSVKDFGAVGDGLVDDWLAIQRAIYASTGTADATTITDDLSIPSNVLMRHGVPTPKMFWGQGAIPVYFPTGSYKISKPLIVGQGKKLIGSGTGKNVLLLDENFKGCGIEDVGSWFQRTYYADRPYNDIDPEALNYYSHQMVIEGITIFGNNNVGYDYGNTNDPLANGVQISGYAWYRWPLFKTFVITASGSQGSNILTLSHNASLPIGIKPKWRIKLQNHATEYDINSVSNNGLTLTLNTTLTESVPLNTVFLVGLPRHCGMRLAGGEDAVIQQCSSHNTDVGIHILDGSPSITITDSSAWRCDVGFWSEASPTLLIKPSGDGNNTLCRLGLNNSMAATIIGLKAESGFASTFRSLIEHSTGTQSATSCLSIIGGAFNSSDSLPSNSEVGKNTSIIDVYKRENIISGNVNCSGFNSIASTGNFLRFIKSEDGSVTRRIPYNNTNDGGHSFIFGEPNIVVPSMLERYPETGYNSRFSPLSIDNSVAGHPIINGVGLVVNCDSGIIYPEATWLRSGQTATFTISGHNLSVGDYVLIYTLGGLTFPSTDSSGLHNVYNGNIVKVQSVVDANNFTLFCNNSGGNSGSTYIQAQRYTELHAIKNNQHRFQMPSILGSASASRIAYGFYDKLRRLVAGLRVSTETEGDWWASKSLNMGGTIDSPTSRILHGTGDPQTAAISAPNGSLYLRTDGDASTTLYVRAGEAWRPLSSWNP